jgi:Eukaryotic cytochrome b561
MVFQVGLERIPSTLESPSNEFKSRKLQPLRRKRPKVHIQATTLSNLPAFEILHFIHKVIIRVMLEKFVSLAARRLVAVTVMFSIAFPTLVTASYSCTFSEPIVLDSEGNVELQQYVNFDEGTFTMKVTYYGGRSFIGIGVNQEGLPSMTPSVAVIGRNDDEIPQVSKYIMSSMYTALPAEEEEQQGIVQSTFEQTDTMSTLVFTQLLSEPNQVAITDETQWLYAIGFDENSWGGHSIRGSFQLSLSPTCTLISDVTPEETEPPVDETSTAVPTDAVDGEQEETEGEDELQDSFLPACPLSEPIVLDSAGNLELEQFVDEASNSFTMRLTYYGGQAWIGVGINEDGVPKMTPAMAVIGRGADGDSPPIIQKYRLSSGWLVEPAESSLQTLVYSSFEQTEDTSTLIFTQLLNEEGQATVTDTTQWIFAVGYDGNQWSGHQIQGSFQLTLTPSCDGTSTSGAEAGTIVITEIESPNRALWMTHGVLMALAWGLLAPLAVGAAVLRVFVDRWAGDQNKGLWFKVHLCLNVLVLLLTIVGCTVAFVAKREQKVDGVKSEKSTHGRIGISILVLVVLQSIAGYFRPALPKPAVENKEKGHRDSLNETQRSETPNSENSMGKKSPLRIAWELLHRLSGMALVAMAWYNCHTGIVRSTTMLEDYSNWTAVFWSVVGVFGGLIVIGKVVLTVTSK